MINIERILNPYENIEEIKKMIIGIYKEDYGTKNFDKIKQKIDNGNFFFETTPDITMKFLFTNAPNISNQEDIYIEYADYITKQQEVAINLKNKLFQLYVIAFNLTKEDIVKLIYKKDLLFKLPLEDYYNNPKNKYQYIKQCEELGIKPIFDMDVIECLLIEQKRLERNSNIKMITDTIWGKRIKEEFYKMFNTEVSPEVIARIIYGNPCTVEVPTDHFKSKPLLYFPVIRQSILGDTDAAFLHELRHMAEQGWMGSGLNWVSGNYKTLNELRVEKHAIKDNENTDVIFSKEIMHKDVYSPYRMIFPLANDFIEEYESTLDELAITRNIPKLEETFGRIDMKEYGIFLNQALDNVINTKNLENYTCSEEEKNKSKEYIKKIRKNAKSNANIN